jgi:putative inorganic carbon (HCO3(-)) transporter
MSPRFKSAPAALAQLDFWLTGILAALGLLRESWLPLIALGILALTLTRWGAGRAILPRTPVDLSVLGLITLLGINLILSPQKSTSIVQAARIFSGIGLMYALVAWLRSHHRLAWTINGMVGLLVLVSVYGLFSVDWSIEKATLIPQAVYRALTLRLADHVHPNVLAGALILLWLPLLGVALFYTDRMPPKQRWVVFSALLFSAVVLLLTKSRGAMVSVVVAVLLLVGLKWKRGWMVSLLAVCLAAIPALNSGKTGLYQALFASSSLSTMDMRFEIWNRAVLLIEDFPLSGTGIGLFSPVVERLYPFFLHPPGAILHSHNLFLQIAVDLGLPGLIAWLAILLGVLHAAWRTWTVTPPGSLMNALAAGWLAALVALAAHGMVDSVTWGMVRSAPLVWVLWGAALANHHLACREAQGTISNAT